MKRLSDLRHVGCFLIPTLLAGMVLVASTGTCTTYTVGSDPACTVATIGEALLLAIVNPGTDEIRIARNQTYLAQHIVISNQSVSLIGGYDTCSDPTADTTTTLSGFGGAPDPVIEVNNTTGSTTTVELANLIVTAGETSGIDLKGEVYLTLTNTTVTANSATLGGGIIIDGTDGAVLVIGESSQVTSNTASENGGGVHCSNGGIIGLFGRIFDNDSVFMGGGMYVNACTVNAFGSANSEISGNSADMGGGIFATGASTVNLYGDAVHPFVVSGNSATTGGGLYLSGFPTIADLVNSSVVNNSCTALGGGVFVGGYAELVMDRDTGPCSRGQRCSALESNSSGVAGTARGGGIAVLSGGSASIRQTYIAGNSGDLRAGIASVDGTNSFLLLEGVMMFDNYSGLQFIHIEADNNAFVRLAHVSTAGNLGPNDKLIHVGTNAHAELLSSAFGENEGLLFDSFSPGGTARVDCVIAHEIASIPIVATRTEAVADPSVLFKAPAFGLMHLRANSPAIDFCDASAYSPTDSDIDNEVRGWDDPTVGNQYGGYDIGADERMVLFADGFETGDTSAW